MRKLLPLFVAALAAGGCKDTIEADLDAISSFRVTVTSGEVGAADAPLAFSTTGSPYGLAVEAVNGRGEPMAWSGRVRVSAMPGQIGSGAPFHVDVADGAATATVSLQKAFGPTRIWVEDLGTTDAPGSYATGVSEALWFATPTLRNLQESTSTTTSRFEGQQVTITSGTLVVTNLTGSGFYVTDVADAEWNSMYVYARERAEDLARGQRLLQLGGSVSEYLGLTEMSNPSWQPGEMLAMPEPVVLDCQTQVAAGGLALERHESSFVEVQDAQIEVCAGFPSCPDLTAYGQWIVRLPCGAQLNVISRLSFPSFDPAANRGQTMPVLRGILRQVAPANPQWILEPRDQSDVCCPTCSPAVSGSCP